MFRWMWILVFFPLFANAAYQRNQARPVNQVLFGETETVRYITQQEIIQSTTHGWETLLGAVIGGLVGNQFGDGRGKQVATAVGAIAGAGIAHQQKPQHKRIEYKLVELLIRTDDGQLINVIQDLDQQMIFEPKQRVRILYFSDGVRVDKER